jgi:PAS domain S-box-containing protein
MLPDPAATDLTTSQLRAVLHGVADAVFVIDPHGTIVFMNGAAQALQGFERLPAPGVGMPSVPGTPSEPGSRSVPDELALEMGFGSSLPDDDPPWLLSLTGETFGSVTLRVPSTGTWTTRVFSYTCTLVDGDPPLNVLTLRDVSGQRDSAQRSRLAFEATPTPVFIARLCDDIVVDANGSFLELTGLTSEEALGNLVTNLGLVAEGTDLLDGMLGLRVGRAIDHLAVALGAGRQVRHVLLSARPIVMDGVPCGIFTCLDVTKEREAQEALRALAHFGETMESMHDFDELVRQGMGILIEQLDFDFGVFQEIDPSGAHHRSLVGDVPDSLRVHLRQTLPPGQGTIGHVARTGEPHVVTDYCSFERRVPGAPELGIVSTVALPVKLGGETRFVVALATLHRRATLDEATVETAMAYVRRLEHALERAEYLSEIEATREATFRALGLALEHRDIETRGHMDRVVALSQRFALEVGLGEEETQALTWGAYLHDLGKIGLPDSVLFKPGSLSAAETDRKGQHTLNGIAMIRGIPFLPTATRQVVRSHHEHWDGSGYPDALAGNEIPLLARMFAFVDVYDALTSERPYKGAWSSDVARQEIERNSGTQFDPDLVKPFLRAVDDWLASQTET